ncbi:MAG: UDP-N-acetyl-D-glucosamine 2-epimerase, UDP-hydrolysing [Bacteroidetes bacterium GWE2_29_8]|nr:MAG: UDP-N-acetyl-D-glucosamine 2-epimerase, UDP-hydrolysing [Bacteroidetes bacterium GWE2_29_8]OFY20041.1 MAG: UDP-N-acetyl-D-glucosamine 2-epimerase, UDP-hydrolysing [Bacteroidetes bacterium GWF2_29_10]
MNIAVLTSSRADYSIYYPLLTKLSKIENINTSIIAFGTHLSKKHGYTIQNIINDGFKVEYCLKTYPVSDKPKDINISISKTIKEFNKIWINNKFDLVIVLGDRYEMFAAVTSAIAFNIKIAHIHGGEETLGAIDNVFRHSITMMSNIHFASTEEYKDRIIKMRESSLNVFNVGALSFDNLKNIKLYTKQEFKKTFNIDISNPTILITFHPETVSFEKNAAHVNELISSLKEIKDYQLLITMPNADTAGNIVRNKLNEFKRNNSNVICVENLGTKGYLSAMKHCCFMLGNTSSGYIEATFFPKYVINIGDRQKGRIVTSNIVNCKIKKVEILNCINNFNNYQIIPKINIFGDGNAADKIINIIKNIVNG